MSEMMTFPDTWEEFEKSYGFTDNEEVYTNGVRLIPSFRVKQWLDHLPSVQPSAKDINVPSTDCISRQAAIEVASRECHELRGVFSDIEHGLKELPSAQPRKGLWIDIKHTFMTKCSVCDWINNDDSSYNFCPNCGADMRGDSE